MELEETKPNEPSFLKVVILFAATILVVVVLAAIFLLHRSHTKATTPYTKHPLSSIPGPVQKLSGPRLTASTRA